MYETVDAIQELFGQASESSTLDFKSGRIFDKFDDKEKTELVKDVTAFANAGGGTIIIGVAESKDGKDNLADKFDPITNDEFKVDRITNVIKNGTEPVFSAFEIKVIDLPDGAGKVCVIKIDKADTAHQSRRECKYFHRTGATSEAMYDYAIRDVMNRKSKPFVSVSFELYKKSNGPKVDYYVLPKLNNEGAVTVREWMMQIDLPLYEGIYNLPSSTATVKFKYRSHLDKGVRYLAELFSGTTQSEMGRLLPGQTKNLDPQSGFQNLVIPVLNSVTQNVLNQQPEIRWSLFVDDATPRHGTIPFDEWYKNAHFR